MTRWWWCGGSAVVVPGPMDNEKSIALELGVISNLEETLNLEARAQIAYRQAMEPIALHILLRATHEEKTVSVRKWETVEASLRRELDGWGIRSVTFGELPLSEPATTRWLDIEIEEDAVVSVVLWLPIPITLRMTNADGAESEIEVEVIPNEPVFETLFKALATSQPHLGERPHWLETVTTIEGTSVPRGGQSFADYGVLEAGSTLNVRLRDRFATFQEVLVSLSTRLDLRDSVPRVPKLGTLIARFVGKFLS